MPIDWEEAARLADFLQFFTRRVIQKHRCGISAETLIEWIEKGEPVAIVDVRTPEEMKVAGFTYPDTLKIPLDRLFERENLKRLEQLGDKKIVIACRSGQRSLVAAAFLQRIGFNNVYSLHGGLIDLVQKLKP
jgi:rhodanese-related sulfurtransferase